MANKQLTASVRLNSTQAERALKNLSKQINNINKATNRINFNKVSTSLNRTSASAQRLNTRLSRIRNTLNGANTSANNLRSTLNRTGSQANNIISRVRQWANAQRSVTSATQSTNSALGSIGSKLKGIAATYLGIMGGKALISTSDTITSTQNRLNAINGGDAELTQQQMDKMYVSANKVRMGYTDMMSNVSKSMTLAGDAFQGNLDNAIRFQEIMAESYALGGASAQEMSTSMYQMIQALGSGVLAGDELRSVREGAPLAYKAIEKFAQGVYNTTDSLKDMASEGMITSEMVVAAIMQSGDEMDKKFKETAMTFGQAWERIKNSAVKAFEPVSNAMRDMLNTFNENGIFEKIEAGFVTVSKVLQITFKLIENSIIWIADNWYWLQHVIVGGLLFLASYFIVVKAVAVWSAIQAAIAWIKVHWVMSLIIGVIFLILLAFYALTQGVISGTEFIVWCAIIIATAFLIAGIVMVSIPMLIAATILALLAICFLFFEQVCYGVGWLGAVIWNIILGIWNVIIWVINVILGALLWLGAAILNIIFVVYNIIAGILNLILGVCTWLFATIYNMFVGSVNAVIQFLWSYFVEPFIGIIEWILNVCNGGFDSFGGAVANLIGNVISWFLSLGKVVTKIIDAIFGTNWTDGLNALQDKVLSWGKNENSITLSREAPELQRMDATDAFSTGFNTIEYANLLDADKAASTGYHALDGAYADFVSPSEWGSAAGEWGAGVTDAVNAWGENLQGGSLLDNIGEKLGLDFDKQIFPDASDPNYDVSNAYAQPSLEELKGINQNTKDALDLSDDDLDFMRKLADMEWRNEFTTAEIKVEMVNNNTINEDRDLDGIISHLSDVLTEEMNNVAYGVHF